VSQPIDIYHSYLGAKAKKKIDVIPHGKSPIDIYRAYTGEPQFIGEEPQIRIPEEEASALSWAGLKERAYELVHPAGGVGGGVARLGIGAAEGLTDLFLGGLYLGANILPATWEEPTQKFMGEKMSAAKAAFDETYEATGGRDVWGGIGEFVPDAVAIVLTAGAVGAAVPALKSAGRVALAESLKGATRKQAVNIIARHVASNAGKGAVRAGIEGTIFESVKEGDIIAGLEAAPAWMLFGAAGEVVGPAYRALKGEIRLAKKPFRIKGIRETKLAELPIEPEYKEAEMMYDKILKFVEKKRKTNLNQIYENEYPTKRTALYVEKHFAEMPKDVREYLITGPFNEALDKETMEILNVLEHGIRTTHIANLETYVVTGPHRIEAPARVVAKEYIGQLKPGIAEKPMLAGKPGTYEVYRASTAEEIIGKKEGFHYGATFATTRPTYAARFIRPMGPEQLATGAQKDLYRLSIKTKKPFVFGAENRKLSKEYLEFTEKESFDLKDLEFEFKDGIEGITPRGRKWLKSRGYDSVVFKKSEGEINPTIIALDPEQVVVIGKTTLAAEAAAIVTPSKIPSWMGSSDAIMGRVWHRWVSDRDTIKAASAELYRKREILDSATQRAMVVIRERLGPHYEKIAGKNKITVDGVNKELSELASDVAEMTHIGELIKKRGEAETKKIINWNHYIKKSENTKKAVDQLLVENPNLARDVVDLAGQHHKVSDEALDNLVSLGILKAKTVEIMKKANPMHVPLMRVLEDSAFVKRKGASALKRRKGSQLEIRDVGINVIENYIRMAAFAERQVFNRTAIETLRKEGRGHLIEKIPITKPLPGMKKKLESVLEAGGYKDFVEEAEQQTFKNMLNKSYQIMRRFEDLPDDAIAYMQNDVIQAFRIKDELLSDVLQHKYFDPNWFQSMMMSLKGVKRAGITMTPEFFLVRNPVRDLMQSLVIDDTVSAIPGVFYTKAAMRFAYEYPTAVYDILRKSTRYKMLERGGAFGAELHPTPQNIKVMINQMTRTNTMTVGFKEGVRNPFRWIDRAANVIEQAPRYIVANNKLNQLMKAANVKEPTPAMLREFAARFRESTAKFSEMGSWAREVGRYVPFFTAGIAGPRTIGRAFVKDPLAVSAKVFQLVTIPSIYLWARNHDKEWYRALNPVERDMYWHVNEYTRIPKPFDIGIIGGSMIERMFDQAFEQDPDGVLETAAVLSRLVNPAQASSLLYGAPLAGLAKGYIGKKDPFFDSYIETPYMQDLPPHLRAKPSTSALAKGITEKFQTITDPMGLSPAMLDFTISELFGGVGRYAARAVDEMLVEREKLKVEPARGLEAMPVARALIRKSPLQTTYSRNIQKFYDNMKSTKAAYDSIRIAEQKGDYDKYKNLIKNKGWKSAIYEGYMRDVSRDIAESIRLYKAIQDPHQYTYMTREQKREYMDRLAEQINRLAKNANDAYNNYKKRSQ